MQSYKTNKNMIHEEKFNDTKITFKPIVPTTS